MLFFLVCVCVRARVRACVCACARARVCVSLVIACEHSNMLSVMEPTNTFYWGIIPHCLQFASSMFKPLLSRRQGPSINFKEKLQRYNAAYTVQSVRC